MSTLESDAEKRRMDARKPRKEGEEDANEEKEED